MKRAHLAVLIAAIALLPTLAGCRRHTATPAATQPVRVRTHTAAPAHLNKETYFVGTVEESSATIMGFENGGRVIAVHVRQGQTVKAGQLLAELDTTATATAWRAAQATLQRAEDVYRRSQQVHASGSLPEAKWIEIKTQVEQARAMADMASHTLKACRLVAATNGVVGSVMVQPGTVVAPAQPVVRLVDIGQLYVRINVPETDMSRLTTGQRAQVQVAADEDRTYVGRIEERSVEADPLTHTYMVRVNIGTTSVKVLPGMVCHVRFADPGSTTGLEVPRRAVQLAPDGSRYVWVVTDSSTAARRAVTIADLTPTGVIIDSGLAPGERVVTDGTAKLSQGSIVTTVQP